MFRFQLIREYQSCNKKFSDNISKNNLKSLKKYQKVKFIRLIWLKKKKNYLLQIKLQIFLKICQFLVSFKIYFTHFSKIS